MCYNISTNKRKEGLIMKALILTNGEFIEKEIDNTLNALQEIVGGYIEIPFLSRVFDENGIDVIINEEGKFIDGLTREIAILKNSEILDIVFGNCIFMSHDDEGNTTELTEKQIEIVKRELEVGVKLMDGNTFESFKVRALFV